MHRWNVAAVEAVVRRGREPFRHIGLRLLSPVIGAEIEGLDLRLAPSAEQLDELRRAFAEHHVLVFRDQEVSERLHEEIPAVFGHHAEPGTREVTLPPSQHGQAMLEPIMLAHDWRADESYRAAPPAGGVLHVERLPKLGAGGDMVFANMHLAYDLLSEPLKALLADLTAVHVPVAHAPSKLDPNTTAEHPVVIAHPQSKRPAIFVNRRHTSHIVQLDSAHSAQTLDMLCRQLEAFPVLTCRIRLTPNTLVVWDNRSTQHLTLQDFRPCCMSGRLVFFAGGPPAGPAILHSAKASDS